jgi:hypothetical protein
LIIIKENKQKGVSKSEKIQNFSTKIPPKQQLFEQKAKAFQLQSKHVDDPVPSTSSKQDTELVTCKN